MAGEIPNAKRLRKKGDDSANKDSRPGFTSILKHPEANGKVGKSKLHHKGGKRK